MVGLIKNNDSQNSIRDIQKPICFFLGKQNDANLEWGENKR